MRRTTKYLLIAGTGLALVAVLPFDLAPAGIASPWHSEDPEPRHPRNPAPPVAGGDSAPPAVNESPTPRAGHGGPTPRAGHAPPRFPLLRLGDSGDRVREVQRRLNQLGFNSGPPSPEYGPALRVAVWAFQKANGLPPVDQIDPPTWHALSRPARIRPLVRYGEPARVEIDLRRQLLTAWQGDKPALVSHISTGNNKHYCKNGHCGVAVTPPGDFRAWWRTPGWTHGPLGDQFYTVYFNGAIGFHGSERVPRHPASHGCIRLPLHNARPLFNMIQTGQQVYVRLPERDARRSGTE
ncbi:L,D-transpeptidase family protein [Streptosporangium sp. NPDC000396]|uniref:L,D-transpeptidase family protein n=1 Tax=Streptosporangium sp. NPDC000396 TaxID=3366185 RepID=UPI0036ADFA31